MDGTTKPETAADRAEVEGTGTFKPPDANELKYSDKRLKRLGVGSGGAGGGSVDADDTNEGSPMDFRAPDTTVELATRLTVFD